MTSGAGAHFFLFEAVTADCVYVRERGNEDCRCEWKDNVAWSKGFGGEDATTFAMGLYLKRRWLIHLVELQMDVIDCGEIGLSSGCRCAVLVLVLVEMCGEVSMKFFTH